MILNSRSRFVLAAITCLASVASARQAADSQPAAVRSLLNGGPVTIVDGPLRHIPIDQARDDVRLPVPAIRRAEDTGDVTLENATGNPFFLGFAAGDYFPPAEERIDPLLRALFEEGREDGRTENTVYAFVMFAKRITPERESDLSAAGARIIGFHPHHSLRVALPEAALKQVAALPFVRWVGLQRPWQKVHPALTHVLQSSDPAAIHDVWVNVFDSDLNDGSTFEVQGETHPVSPLGPESVDFAELEGRLPKRVQSLGWQQANLEAIDVEIRSYDDGLRAFRARLAANRLPELVALDHVQFVELDRPFESHHEESMPIVNADAKRIWWPGNSSASVVAGIMDSGIENSHLDLGHFWGAGWNLSNSSYGPWDDVRGHGTHVAGTVLGDGTIRKGRQGVAPQLGFVDFLRVYNVKLLNDFGSGIGVVYQDALDIIRTEFTQSGQTTQRPHVVNNSYGTPTIGGNGYYGSEANARALDTHVWVYNQFMVFSAGNQGSGSETIGLEGCAKNVFTVGNVTRHKTSASPGEIWPSSSRGPCADGRWKPNVVAPGVDIWSADAANLGGYIEKTGTSMAAPHVTGIAAQLCDHHAFLRYNPPTLSALLMATAISRHNYTIGALSNSLGHLNQYGTGRVDAARAHEGSSQHALGFWGWYQDGDTHTEIDFTVNPGATRLSVAMFYTDTAASPGASQAQVRNLDMYLDPAPFTGSGNSGDYFAHQSDLDNSEVRVLNNPQVGDWKIKLWPEYPGALFDPRVGVAVLVTYGDTTPTGTFSLHAVPEHVQPGEASVVSATIWADSDVASAVLLESTAVGNTLHDVTTTHLDNDTAHLMDNASGGHDIMLGNIRHGNNRLARWWTSWATEGVHTFKVDETSENMVSMTREVTVTVDGTPPGPPTSLQSSTHTPGDHSCDGFVSATWTGATDNLSGIEGYSHRWDTNPIGIAPLAITLWGDVTELSQQLTPTTDPDGWYLHVRAFDRSGNWSNTAHLGPFHINEATSQGYCSSNVNSTGNVASLEAWGVICLADSQLTLRTTGLPPNKPGFYITSRNQGFTPLFGGSQGNLCLSGPITRFGDHVLTSGAHGVMTMSVDFDDLPGSLTIDHGETHNFQLWFRDSNPQSTSNTSNGLRVTFD